MKNPALTMIQPYQQTTYETCLACCLLQAARKEVTRNEERAILNHSLDFSRDFFVLGHLDYFIKKYDAKFDLIADNQRFVQWLGQVSANISLKCEKITLGLIDEHLSSFPILLIDDYYLYYEVHYPHWITVLRKRDDSYEIFDVWDGKEKIISAKLLEEAIRSLREHLNFCPQLILLQKDH